MLSSQREGANTAGLSSCPHTATAVGCHEPHQATAQSTVLRASQQIAELSSLVTFYFGPKTAFLLPLGCLAMLVPGLTTAPPKVTEPLHGQVTI